MTLLHLLVGRFQWMVPDTVMPKLSGIDGTGFEDHHCTPYYTYRAQLRRSYTKLSAASHLGYQLVQSCAISHRPIHGTRHVRRLLREIPVPPDVIVADAEYDSERVHLAIRRRGSYGVIPVRGNNAVCRPMAGTENR
ncbi:MAG: transposase [candidate division WOR-3 bacterium]